MPSLGLPFGLQGLPSALLTVHATALATVAAPAPQPNLSAPIQDVVAPAPPPLPSALIQEVSTSPVVVVTTPVAFVGSSGLGIIKKGGG